MDRYHKILKENKDMKYAGMYYNFEVFHMLEKQIPVDSVEVKESVHAFTWEPMGSKFAVIHEDSQSLNVSFYGLKKGTEPEILKKYERKVSYLLIVSSCWLILYIFKLLPKLFT